MSSVCFMVNMVTHTVCMYKFILLYVFVPLGFVQISLCLRVEDRLMAIDGFLVLFRDVVVAWPNDTLFGDT